MSRRRQQRPRRTKAQRELLNDLVWFRRGGIVGIAVGALVAVGGGSTTVAWTVGLTGASSLGLALLFPVVAKSGRPTVWLLVSALLPALLAGAAYAVFQSETVWWIGGLGALPAVAVLLYFEDGRKRKSFDSGSDGAWAAPGDGGGGGDGSG